MYYLGCKFMNLKFKLLFLLIIVLIILQSSFALAENRTFVVANTNDWQSTYLIDVYASSIGAQIVYLKNLGDSEVKTKLMAKTDNVIIFESKETPVVKNYKSFLSVNGFESVGEYQFFNAFDLQEYLYSQLKPDGVYIFGNDFGMEPLVLTPYLLKNNYFPMFFSKDSTSFFYRISRRKPITVVGRIPLRSVEQLNPTLIIGNPQKTISQLSSLVNKNISSEWGVITRIDEIDYDSIRKDIPVFVFYSQTYLPTLANQIKESKIKNFEVIGGNVVDIAQSLKSQSGEDLKMMLKFGRKITNFDGLENKILSVDTVSLPYPYEKLEIESINYYEKLGILTLTLKNTGNIGVYSFSNIDFGGAVESDNIKHFIPAGQSKTIPYNLSTTKVNENATLTIQYGYDLPLRNNIKGDKGTSIIQKKVSILDHVEKPKIELTKSNFNSKTGILSIGAKSLSEKPLKAQVEILINGVIYTSDLEILNPKSSSTLIISFPYLSNLELLDKTFNATIYYGEDNLLFTQSEPILFEDNSINMVVVLVVVLIALLGILFVVFRKRLFGVKKNSKAKSSSKAKKVSRTKSKK